MQLPLYPIASICEVYLGNPGLNDPEAVVSTFDWLEEPTGTINQCGSDTQSKPELAEICVYCTGTRMIAFSFVLPVS